MLAPSLIAESADTSSEQPTTDAALRDALCSAQWIGPQETAGALGQRPAYLLRCSFTVAAGTTGLRLHATAHALYEAFINGVRVGDLELTPGFSSYRKRLEVQSYDVSELVSEGSNTVVVVVSDGWFRGRHGFERRGEGFGSHTGVLLAITDASGRSVVDTGPQWQSRPSHIWRADLMDGQAADLRKLDAGWFTGADDGSWTAVRLHTDEMCADRERLVAPSAPPVRRIEELTPRTITRPRPGTVVVDFGQNINGWVRLDQLGPAGTHLVLTHGEAIDSAGLVTTEHLRGFNFATRQQLPAGQVDEVISAGRPGECFEPRHTTHGFRYVQVDAAPDGLDLSGSRAVVVHSDLPRTGEFDCSDERLARLHEVVRWSLRDNICAVPTDCPQRERSGFTGDWQIFVATAALMYDVRAFSRRWLADLAADQWADGRVPTIIPNPAGDRPSGIVFEDASAGSAGWGDAATIVPWELWRA
ncbi:MAG: family 78 glycoside hydrolase catalytic domain, partial [Propionibacteriaceae bacterium]|nr:family 78 glycoside hydrolase catalytic domain [Propionibacteriaceae bacterium]